MGKQIHTKWHRLQELLLEKDVYLTAPHDGYATYWGEVNSALEPLEKTIKECDQFPKFVMDPELVSLATEEEFILSLWDMKKAGVLRMPFPRIVMEFAGSSDARMICVLTEADGAEKSVGIDCDFYGLVFSINKDGEGDYLIAPASITHLKLAEINGEPHVTLTGVRSAWTGELADELMDGLSMKEGSNLTVALCSVMLLMATQGVEKEVVDPTPLNRNRRAAGKPLIPHHTYIHIGHVYNKDGTTTRYDARKSPRPHWRRGHIRHVRHGAGRTQTRPVYIAPMLVSWHGDEIAESLKLPEYDVRK